jgi:D-aspartate ligase
VDFLRDLQDRIGERPFLIVTDEPALLTISEHREELEALYRFRLPARDTVLMLHDKARFQENAVKHGWPVPNAMIASLGLPMILKPADKRHFHEGRAPRLVVPESSHDAVSAAEGLLHLAGEVLVQEVIEGPDDDIYFCLFYRGRDGETVGMFTGRKLASSPPGTGARPSARLPRMRVWSVPPESYSTRWIISASEVSNTNVMPETDAS